MPHKAVPDRENDCPRTQVAPQHQTMIALHARFLREMMQREPAGSGGHYTRPRAGRRIASTWLRRQREIIAKIESAGRDSWQARRLLDPFEDVQQLHIEERDRLEKELTESQK